MKYLLPLLFITVCGLAAEPPAVKSKAAKELLKHPEFKKAMEAAPGFTKAVLTELDKHAPEDVKPIKTNPVVFMHEKGTPLYDPRNEDWAEHAAGFYNGWDLGMLQIQSLHVS